MSILTFDAVSVDGAELDEAPESSADAHYCQEPGCSNEVFRKGTVGRFPTKCEEHKKSRGSSAAPRKSSANVSTPALAKQAAAVLAQVNDLVGLGMMTVSFMPQIPFEFPATYKAINDNNEAFRVAAEEALSTDPALCRQIVKVGATGGKAALVMAYVTFAMGLVPAVVSDVRAMRENAELESEPGGDA